MAVARRRPPHGAAAGLAPGRGPRHRRPPAGRAAATPSPAPSPLEAAKPIKTARVEAERAVSTFQFAAAEARTLAGEVVPLDASAPGEGKLGFTLRLPIGVVGAISPFNFPLNLVAHKLAPAIAAGCPVVLKPASPDAAVGHRPGRPAHRRVRPARRAAQRRHRRRRHGRQRPRRPPRRRHDHVHRLARGRLGHPRPGAAQEGRPRAGQQRAGDHRARRRLEGGRRQDQGRRLQPRRPVVHLDAAASTCTARSPTTSPTRWPSGCSRSSSATRCRRATDVSALISERRARPGGVMGRRGRGRRGAASSTGGTIGADGVLRADAARRRHARHEGVRPRGVRPGGHHPGLRRASTTPWRSPTTPTTACRRPSSPPTSAAALQGGAGARLRRRAGQRGADVAGRPDALRRRARLAATPARARTTPCGR